MAVSERAEERSLLEINYTAGALVGWLVHEEQRRLGPRDRAHDHSRLLPAAQLMQRQPRHVAHDAEAS